MLNTPTEILGIPFEFSPKLGVRSLPQIDRANQSNIPGLYIVGDLANAPVIKVALNQGFEVATRVAEQLGAPCDDPDMLDVVVIGAGPAGIGAALALKAAGLRYVMLERERPFHTIQNFPKKKLIFSEPADIDSPHGFWFQDAPVEDLIEKWNEALDSHGLVLHQPEEVTSIEKNGEHFVVSTHVGQGGLDPAHPRIETNEAGGARNDYRALRVILAIGRRAEVKVLEIPGEELPKVRYTLKDPAEYAGRKVMVVGGGDSAVEAAIACTEAGADVTLSYRQAVCHRAKARNLERLDELDHSGALRTEYQTTPVAITEDKVVLKRHDETFEVPNDDVLVFIGTKLPKSFLRGIGIRMQGDMDWARALWIASFALLTYCFYVLKSGTECVGGTPSRAVCEGGMWVAKKAFFPFRPDDLLGALPGLLTVDLGFRVVDAAFWGTVVYSAFVAGFGLLALRRYESRAQRRRYLSLITFQLVFLFGVPELIAPLIIERPWKVYALTVPWPLSIWSLIDAPSWAGDRFWVATGWLLAGGFVSFVAMPLYVWRNNESFCSYLCGCGGLAETFGDRWRHLAPRGRTAKRAEGMGRVIFLLAVPVTLLILNDAWGFFATDALYQTKAFAQHWYSLMVDFWLAAVVGVALYPYLGNRMWCRFFCPLRAYMEILSKRIGRLAIHSNDKCIGCGECTRFCQMGIDVQAFAQKQEPLANDLTACIQCGICVEVCPMNVLELGPGLVLEPGRPAELTL